MNNPQRRTNNDKEEQSQPSFQIFQQGGHESPKGKILLLCLALLNAVLLICVVVIGMKCANFQSVSPHLINGLKDLRQNCSDVQLAEDEAREAIQTTEEKHRQLKAQLEELKNNGGNLHTQLQSLQTEAAVLHTNVSSLEGSCGKCPPDWVFHNSSCYYFSIVNQHTDESVEYSTFKRNWQGSREDCVSRGSDLTVIDSPEEQKYLSAKGKSLVNGDATSWLNGFWVGLTDIENEEKWVWINNVTEVEPRYWYTGEPNNHGPNGEDCAVITYRITSPWMTRYDAKCMENTLYWICETHAK